MSHDVRSDQLGRRAVVIGASLAGLVAARVLSPRFEEVMVFDRDRLPETPEPRGGVAQGRHGHGLLASGFSTLQSLFPSLEADLQAAGAIAGDLIGDARWHQHGYTKARFHSGLRSLFMSRPLLEGIVRAQVAPVLSKSRRHRRHAVTIAAGSDFAFPGVTGTRPLGTSAVNWYLGLVHKAASWDRVVCRAFFDVGNLRKAPTSLFRPSIVARVAAGAWAGRATRPYEDLPTAEPGDTPESLPLHNRAVMFRPVPGTTVTRSNVRRAS